MAELIDRAALRHNAANVPMCGDCEQFYAILGEVARVIDEAPTIDAVPVVRCRDCRHSSKIANSTKGERHCWSLRGRNNGDGFSRVNGDGYCDEGARMDADRVDANGNAPERGREGQQ